MVGAANMEMRGHACEQRKDLIGLETAAFRHHLHAEPRDMHHGIHAGAVAHRRRMQDRVAR